MTRTLLALIALAATSSPLAAQPITHAEQQAIDTLVAKTLADTKVPSASVAVVRDGKIVMAKAYGTASAKLGQATPAMPFQIASNSKQFIAAALQLLENDGKLSLDDKVSTWEPQVTRAGDMTIRQLLNHTSGLQDFWPQDYDFVAMETPVKPDGIIGRWGKKPLDYEPGTRWQYSNTGYVVAGRIIEKASGMPLMSFLTKRIFVPLHMHPLNIDDSNTPAYPAGNHRYAAGPVRVAKAPARGWLYSAGELSMTAEDLAKWDIARIERTLLPKGDWAEQEAPTILTDGTTNGYGLGVSSGMADGRRFINHGGESVGFLSQNTVYPDSRAAIVVLTNADFGDVTGPLTEGIADIVLPKAQPVDAHEGDRIDEAAAMLAMLASGQLDRSKMTDDLNYFFNADAVADYRASLTALGQPAKIEMPRPARLRGGFVNRNYRVTYSSGKSISVVSYAEPGAAGRWEQFMVSAD
nr:serine hydrolase domain-containing protein [uncultured Sphingomonas sp.]